MRLLKSISLTLVVIASMSVVSFAQKGKQQQAATTTTTTTTEQQQAKKSNAEGKSGSGKDMATQISEMQQAQAKLKTKEAQTSDPAKKADYNTMISKIDQCVADYNAMQNMPEAQKAEQEKKIHAQMKDIHETEKAMKAKYGGDKSGNGDKSGKQQKAHTAAETPDSK